MLDVLLALVVVMGEGPMGMDCSEALAAVMAAALLEGTRDAVGTSGASVSSFAFAPLHYNTCN